MSGAQTVVQKHQKAADSLNMLIIVGAFIAGVQGQLLQITLGFPAGPLTKTCNTVALVGLAFEVAGVFFGALAAVAMRRTAQDGTDVTKLMTTCRDELLNVLMHAEKNVEIDLKLATPSSPRSPWSTPQHDDADEAEIKARRLVESLNTLKVLRQHRNVRGSLFDDLAKIIEYLSPAHPAIRTLRSFGSPAADEKSTLRRQRDGNIQEEPRSYQEALARLTGGDGVGMTEARVWVPLASMATGVLCLALSVVILAAVPLDVLGVWNWVLCTVVLLAVGWAATPWRKYSQAVLERRRLRTA